MLEKVSPKHRFVVATNTLRVAQNRADFITAAKVILGADINVLSGEEEAALIFTGVTSDLAIAPHKPFEKLVIDIGGGSTELVLGKNSPNQLQSFPMGCVAFSHDYFPQRKINNAHLQNAIEAAQAIIESSKSNSLDASETIWSGWQVCIGSSGTMKALIALSALEEGGMAYLNRASMANIEQQLLAFDYLDDVSIKGVRVDRGEVLPAGYAILMGIMRSLNLDRIYFSTGALREGVLLKALQEK
jgi:exopolyphosphatase/guanosine-5'-triphosphate,3'-diphosphate pyrophosphatase